MCMSEQAIDITGKRLYVGDFVAFAGTSGHRASMHVGVVTKIHTHDEHQDRRYYATMPQISVTRFDVNAYCNNSNKSSSLSITTSRRVSVLSLGMIIKLPPAWIQFHYEHELPRSLVSGYNLDALTDQQYQKLYEACECARQSMVTLQQDLVAN